MPQWYGVRYVQPPGNVEIAHDAPIGSAARREVGVCKVLQVDDARYAVRQVCPAVFCLSFERVNTFEGRMDRLFSLEWLFSLDRLFCLGHFHLLKCTQRTNTLFFLRAVASINKTLVILL